MTTMAKHPYSSVSWFDLMTPDPARAREFYAGLFGWTYEIGGPESGHYALAQVTGRDAAGIGKRPENAAYPSVWTAYFNVEDADATAKAITDAGGKIMMLMDVMEL